jgi:hypothetical protein
MAANIDQVLRNGSIQRSAFCTVKEIPPRG